MEVLLFVAMAVLGGLYFVFMVSDSWDDLRTFSSVRHMVASVIAGVLYYSLHGEYGFPNTVMCFVVGYMGPTFVDQIIEKRRRMGGVQP